MYFDANCFYNYNYVYLLQALKGLSTVPNNKNYTVMIQLIVALKHSIFIPPYILDYVNSSFLCTQFNLGM